MRTLRLLGAVQVAWQRGPPPRFRSERTKVLLGYLVVERRPLARDALATLFWPDEALATGRANLRRELHNLGNLLPGCWQVDRKTVLFTPDADTGVDLDMLRRLEEEERWAQAAEFACGEFLEGLSLEDNLEFETWLLGERERWRQRAKRVLTRAAQVEREQGSYPEARRHLARLLQLVPWHEEGHRHMMRLLAHGGQFSAALKQYEQCRDILAKELAVPPSMATTALYERIKLAMALPRHNLPPQATPFVGREDEVAALERRLADPDCRLLTLTGVGGIGKSRLALEVARLAATEESRLFLHGVTFVPLAGADREDLVAAIGSGLGIAFSGRQPAEHQLLAYLRGMELLLLLDNYEHLLPDTGLLAGILREAPDVKLLVTSRERLHLQEEWLFEVDGLPYPEEERTDLTGDGEPEYASVRLFTACARPAHRTAALAPSRREVMAICHLVQGMPLALELSAARLNSLPPADVLAELKHGLDILATETQNISPRHSSLRAAFDASWTGLPARDKKVLSRLSLFRGGFTREAAAKAAGATLPVLSSLNDKSLIRLMPSGRYEMHELLRHYAAEKLAGSGKEGMAREQYAAYYGAFLREREQRLLETHQEETLKELGREMENIRPAWRWLVRHEKVEVLNAALWTLAMFYFLRSRLAEGLTLIEETRMCVARHEGLGEEGRRLRVRVTIFRACLLYFPGRLAEACDLLLSTLDRIRCEGNSQDIGWALFLLGQALWDGGEVEGAPYLKEAYTTIGSSGPSWLEAFLATRLADMLSVIESGRRAAEADQLLRRALAIGRELDNPLVLSSVFTSVGRLESRRGAYRQAQHAYGQSLRAARRIDSLYLMGLVLSDLGYLAYAQGKLHEAQQSYFESRLLFRRMGARRSEATTTGVLGEIARAEGKADEAMAYYQQCLALQEEVGEVRNGPCLTCNMGHALLHQSRLESAMSMFHDSLDGLGESKDETLAGLIFIGIAGVLLARGQSVGAARLAGAAEARFAAEPSQLEPADRQDRDRILAAIKEQLDEETFRAGWEAGQALSLEQAVALAREVGAQR